MLKLVQKAKLNPTDARTKIGSGYQGYEKFIDSLLDVDFNNRNEEAKYK